MLKRFKLILINFYIDFNKINLKDYYKIKILVIEILIMEIRLAIEILIMEIRLVIEILIMEIRLIMEIHLVIKILNYLSTMVKDIKVLEYLVQVNILEFTVSFIILKD